MFENYIVVDVSTTTYTFAPKFLCNDKNLTPNDIVGDMLKNTSTTSSHIGYFQLPLLPPEATARNMIPTSTKYAFFLYHN